MGDVSLMVYIPPNILAKIMHIFLITHLFHKIQKPKVGYFQEVGPLPPTLDWTIKNKRCPQWGGGTPENQL